MRDLGDGKQGFLDQRQRTSFTGSDHASTSGSTCEGCSGASVVTSMMPGTGMAVVISIARRVPDWIWGIGGVVGVIVRRGAAVALAADPDHHTVMTPAMPAVDVMAAAVAGTMVLRHRRRRREQGDRARRQPEYQTHICSPVAARRRRTARIPARRFAMNLH